MSTAATDANAVLTDDRRRHHGRSSRICFLGRAARSGFQLPRLPGGRCNTRVGPGPYGFRNRRPRSSRISSAMLIGGRTLGRYDRQDSAGMSLGLLTSLREFCEPLRRGVRAEFGGLFVPLTGLSDIGHDADGA
jgi:hypothetical protein